jgi:hypothetical protein
LKVPSVAELLASRPDLAEMAREIDLMTPHEIAWLTEYAVVIREVSADLAAEAAARAERRAQADREYQERLANRAKRRRAGAI